MPALSLLARKATKRPVVFQSEESECGLACLATLIQFYDGKLTLNDLRKLYASTRGGVSAVNLIKLAALVGIRLIPEEDIKLEEIERGQVPCIALWDDSHYIIIAEIRDEEIIVLDPALGLMKINKEFAARRFSGLILEPRIIEKIFEKSLASASSNNTFRLPAGVRASDLGQLFIFLGLVLLLLSSIFEVGSAQVQNLFFDWIVQMQMKQWSTPLGYIQIATGLLAALALFAVSLAVAKKYTELTLKWNKHIYRRLLRLPEEYFLNRRSGDVIAKFNNADQILRSSQSSLINLTVAIVNLMVLFLILWLTSFALLAVTVVAVIIAVFVAYALTPIEIQQQEQVQQGEAYSEKALYEIISDFQQIRLEGREHYYLKKIAKSEFRRIRSTNTLEFTFSQQEFLLNILDAGSSTLLLIVAALVIMAGRMSLGQYAALDVLIGLSLSPLMNLSGVVRTLQETKVAFARVGDLADYPLDRRYQVEKTTMTKENSLNDKILAIRDLTYRYSMFSEAIINKSSIELEDSQFPVVITGESGVGKSTLALLLASRMVPDSGTITIEGRDTATQTTSEINSLVQLVNSKTYIRGGSVLYNLRIGNGKPSREILDIAKTLKITNLPLFANLSRQLSDSYGGLSGGELILIQLIRALAKRPKLLVCDEIFNAISSEYHDVIIQGIAKYCPNTIFITHEIPDGLSRATRLEFSSQRLTEAA